MGDDRLRKLFMGTTIGTHRLKGKLPNWHDGRTGLPIDMEPCNPMHRAVINIIHYRHRIDQRPPMWTLEYDEDKVAWQRKYDGDEEG